MSERGERGGRGGRGGKPPGSGAGGRGPRGPRTGSGTGPGARPGSGSGARSHGGRPPFKGKPFQRREEEGSERSGGGERGSSFRGPRGPRPSGPDSRERGGRPPFKGKPFQRRDGEGSERTGGGERKPPFGSPRGPRPSGGPESRERGSRPSFKGKPFQRRDGEGSERSGGGERGPSFGSPRGPRPSGGPESRERGSRPPFKGKPFQKRDGEGSERTGGGERGSSFRGPRGPRPSGPDSRERGSRPPFKGKPFFKREEGGAGRPRGGERRGPSSARPLARVPPALPPILPPEAAPVGMRLAEVEEIELEIEKLVAGGEGLGRLDGVPIFVARTAPGDRVRARLVTRRPDFGRAEVLEVLTAGPGRREPPCPHFSECGGCDLQHLDERHQLRYKVEAAVETLRRLAKIPLPPPSEVLSGAAWGYRIRTQLHTAPVGAGFQAGYHARGSKRLVPIQVCPVLDPRLEEEAVRLGRRLGAEAPGRVDLAIGGDGRVAAAPAVAGLDEGELRRTVAGFEYAYDARCFFQGHQGLLDALVDRAVGEARGELAFDLYGGVGLFALPLATRYARVITVEADRIASRYARRNARAAHLDGVEAVSRSVDTWIGEALPEDADRVLVDPPRQGLSTPVRAALAARPPRRLTYVSCHAAALARDLMALGPGLEVESILFIDLFPQTGHLETVVQLVRRP